MDSELQKWHAAGESFSFRGHQIFYRQAGTGPDLLLVHGYLTAGFDYHRLWSTLTARYRVTVPDMLGMGFSDKPWRRYSVFEHADMFDALLARLGISRCLVLTHDLGDTVVQELLARRLDNPDLPTFGRVVFLNGGLFAGVYRPRPIQKILSSPLGHVIGPLLPRRAVRTALCSVFGPETQPDARTLEQMLALIDLNGGRRVAHLVGRFNAEREAFGGRFRDALIETTTPLRFINGGADPNSGAHMADAYERMIPDADVVRLPQIGHWPQLEAPEAVLDATLEFFSRGAVET